MMENQKLKPQHMKCISSVTFFLFLKKYIDQNYSVCHSNAVIKTTVLSFYY